MALFSHAAPLTLQDYMALTGPSPTARITYGSARSQYVELFQPAGQGPFPVVLLIHGGCWTAAFGGMTQLRPLATALSGQGIAVWSIEYRRVDEAGGGYPGTYQDVNAALQKLEAEAAQYRLDLTRLAAVGHSAGGQLVQWLAGRGQLPHTSPLVPQDRLVIRNIISLGGLADLRQQQGLIKSRCGIDIAQLTGSASPQRPDVFADTNAADLMPNGSHTVLITGELDQISPPRVARDYAEKARQAGDRAEVIILPGASHFDEVAPTAPAWQRLLPVIRGALRMDGAEPVR